MGGFEDLLRTLVIISVFAAFGSRIMGWINKLNY